MPHNISYTNIASILLKEINFIRNDPQSFISTLKDRLLKYDEEGNYFPLTGLNFSIKTKEGKQGVQNLINFLSLQKECPSLEWSFQLHQAADKRCHFLSTTQQKNSLNRIANLRVGELVSQFTSWKGNLVELTFYGFIEPKEFIAELLLEDGKEKKDNRQQFFNRQYGFIGIGINTHEKYRFVIVMIMTTQVQKHEPFMMYKQFNSEQDISNDLAHKQIYYHQQDEEAPLNPSEQECNLDECSIY